MTKNSNDLVEIIATPKQTLVEKYIDLEEYVRIDMNVIQYPIFNISKRKKVNEIYKYYFDKNKQSYLEVIPSAGNYVPGATEELVFLAIMKIFEKNGQPKEFYFTTKELMQEMRISEAKFRKDFLTIKKSLKRLATTNYNFKNSMYSNFHKKIIRATTITNLFSLQIINFEDETNLKLINKLKEKYGNRFKEVYKISFNNIIHYNLVHKGHIAYNYDLLLDMKDPLLRKIYIYLDKARYDDLFYEETLEKFSNRIPFSIRHGNVYKFLAVLEEKLKNLIDIGILSKYEIVQETPVKNSILKFYFEKNCNILKEKTLFNSINIKNSINEIIGNDIFDIENFTNKKDEGSEVEAILKILPKDFRNIKNIQSDIKKSINHYGTDKVLKNAFYINSLMQTNKNVNIRTVFKKSLKDSWYEEIVEKPIKTESKVEVLEVLENSKKNENLEENLVLLMSYYLKNYRFQIIEKVKELYCEETDTLMEDINANFFKASFKSLLKKYLLDNGIDSLDKKDNLTVIDNEIVIKESTYLTIIDIEKEIEKFIFIYTINNKSKSDIKNKLLKYFYIFIDYKKQDLNSLKNQFTVLIKSFEEYGTITKS
ncbi:hypothetical protein [Cetobacterium sp.]|uniref:hypothetical protein n=1 Tax=Cetobacterium sp. TaxID=2071632 RepID=UPI003F3096F4